MNKKIIRKLSIIFAIILAVCFIFITNISNADTGPKPSITIKLKNMNSSNYYLDLLTNESLNSKDFYNDYDKGSTEEKDLKEEPIYKYKEDGWIATAMRDNLLWGSIVGNEEYTHTFNYFGTPDVFKVIIQMPDGSIKVSDVINRMDFNARYTIDVTNMKIINNVSYIERAFDVLSSVLPYIIIVVVTVIVELKISSSFLKHKEGNLKENKKIIITTNILTNLAFQLIMVSLPDLLEDIRLIDSFAYFDYYIITFIVLEIIIFYGEYYTYKNRLKIENSEAILKYTLFANIITAALTFFPVDTFLGSFIEALYMVIKEIIIELF